MLVSNSFDLWQRDAFFSAAEEVQESADILESAYRLWIRQKKDGLSSNDLDELRREVQTALGTAKWQLEEFEKAVRLSYGNCRDHSRMARHQQFLVAIESLITRVEDTLRDTLNEEGKQPFRWVNLDEDERDDLAMFLSGSETFTKSARNKIAKSSNSLTEENLCKKKDLDFAACSTSTSTASNMQGKGSPALKDDVVINMEQPISLIELSAREALGTRGDMNCDTDRTRSAKRTHISPNSGSLKIVIPNGDDNMSTMSTIEATPKVKGFKTSSVLQFRGISCINKDARLKTLTVELFHATHTHFDAINFPVGTLFGSLKLKRDYAARSNTIDVSRFFHMIQRIYQHPMYQLPKAMLSDMIHICCLDCSAPTQ